MKGWRVLETSATVSASGAKANSAPATVFFDSANELLREGPIPPTEAEVQAAAQTVAGESHNKMADDIAYSQ